MIPKVKTWQVRYYQNGTLIATYPVRTINKRFAIWLACEEGMWAYHAQADRVTVTPEKPKIEGK